MAVVRSSRDHAAIRPIRHRVSRALPASRAGHNWGQTHEREFAATGHSCWMLDEIDVDRGTENVPAQTVARAEQNIWRCLTGRLSCGAE